MDEITLNAPVMHWARPKHLGPRVTNDAALRHHRGGLRGSRGLAQPGILQHQAALAPGDVVAVKDALLRGRLDDARALRIEDIGAGADPLEVEIQKFVQYFDRT